MRRSHLGILDSGARVAFRRRCRLRLRLSVFTPINRFREAEVFFSSSSSSIVDNDSGGTSQEKVRVRTFFTGFDLGEAGGLFLFLILFFLFLRGSSK